MLRIASAPYSPLKPEVNQSNKNKSGPSIPTAQTGSPKAVQHASHKASGQSAQKVQTPLQSTQSGPIKRATALNTEQAKVVNKAPPVRQVLKPIIPNIPNQPSSVSGGSKLFSHKAPGQPAQVVQKRAQSRAAPSQSAQAKGAVSNTKQTNTIAIEQKVPTKASDQSKLSSHKTPRQSAQQAQKPLQSSSARTPSAQTKGTVSDTKQTESSARVIAGISDLANLAKENWPTKVDELIKDISRLPATPRQAHIDAWALLRHVIHREASRPAASTPGASKNYVSKSNRLAVDKRQAMLDAVNQKIKGLAPQESKLVGQKFVQLFLNPPALSRL